MQVLKLRAIVLAAAVCSVALKTGAATLGVLAQPGVAHSSERG